MFTGLVEMMAEVVSLEAAGPGKKVVLREATIAAESAIGDSIAVNGCCLTVIELSGDTFAFEAGPETLIRTNLGELEPGCCVNLERSLRAGDRLGGHFVTGHIDAVGTLDERQDDQEWSTLWFRFPTQYARFMASKASIAVDGVSLTLVDVEVDRFSVALIPHTLAVTTLGNLSLGDRVNLETDLLAKYVGEQVKAFDRT